MTRDLDLMLQGKLQDYLKFAGLERFGFDVSNVAVACTHEARPFIMEAYKEGYADGFDVGVEAAG